MLFSVKYIISFHIDDKYVTLVDNIISDRRSIINCIEVLINVYHHIDLCVWSMWFKWLIFLDWFQLCPNMVKVLIFWQWSPSVNKFKLKLNCALQWQAMLPLWFSMFSCLFFFFFIDRYTQTFFFSLQTKKTNI